MVPPTGRALVTLDGGRFRFTSTRFGVDVEVLQSARRVGRLRIAGGCVLMRGLSTRCRFKTIDTRLTT